MKYTCKTCDEVHENWPAIGFMTPDSYDQLSEKEKEQYVKEITSDFCVLEYEDQTDYFIQCVLFMEVPGHCEDLQYGVWVSLSKKSFDDYVANYDADEKEEGAIYFGYLCNLPPEYADTHAIKTDVVTKGGKCRPEIFPHKDQMDIPFVRDYYEGITKEEAERRISYMINK